MKKRYVLLTVVVILILLAVIFRDHISEFFRQLFIPIMAGGYFNADPRI